MTTINLRFKKKLEEIYCVSPNNLGNDLLTTLYKKVTGRIKTMPFLLIIPVSLIIAFLLYLIAGFLVIRIASLLQYGF